MNHRRFAGIFAAIFMIGALPLLVSQPSGIAGAGLGAGFMTAIHNPYHILLFVMTGYLATLLGRLPSAMLPVTMLLMLTIGAGLAIDPEKYPLIRLFIFSAIMLYAAAVGVAYTKAFLLSAAVTSSIAFQLGYHFMETLPLIAPPLHYLLGILTGAALLMAIGISLGIAFYGRTDSATERMKAIPVIASFLAFFVNPL
jgi:hydrogenase/urease accessory protein HupE